ncbi:hypothetical protein P5705_17995 [Pseudomonas entomophila]|uniref:hypothetical protein n=1 Tax=Pseudomonas entomophila TaxID=312306 RepID=UPI0024055A0C|nr:hypothetical protein [Pseudomonas entomophila]MDF9619542.1 hypothetical protein [Pseudomonas entomophila]
MDDLLPLLTFVVALGALAVGISVLTNIRKMSNRIDAIEVDRAWFNNHREEQLQSLQGEVSELRSQVSDLISYQLGEGRFKRDPEDPR